ncbi:hypothetical protein [Streptomyces sp. NPDC002133]|uniref:hypothetical protein n=1 Tax=Streptomyces sp. NPDC002133 TaxID=3154409 RepID=UPI003334142E
MLDSSADGVVHLGGLLRCRKLGRRLVEEHTELGRPLGVRSQGATQSASPFGGDIGRCPLLGSLPHEFGVGDVEVRRDALLVGAPVPGEERGRPLLGAPPAVRRHLLDERGRPAVASATNSASIRLP